MAEQAERLISHVVMSEKIVNLVLSSASTAALQCAELRTQPFVVQQIN